VPVVKFDLKVSIFENGKVDFCMDAKVRQDAIWLPRFGYEFALPGENKEWSYYGYGPGESYCDMKHGAHMGMYHSNVDK
jgi:beta-galactosidase